jgi:hypothetical protein
MWPYRPISDWALTGRGGGRKRKRQWIPKREPRFPIPTDKAVPRYDSKWDSENDKDEWSHNHFIHFILVGLRRVKIKPINYSQVTAVEQGPSSFSTETKAYQHCTRVTGKGNHPER